MVEYFFKQLIDLDNFISGLLICYYFFVFYTFKMLHNPLTLHIFALFFTIKRISIQ
jgi:hypothetical protein